MTDSCCERIRPPCLGASTFLEDPRRSALEARLLWRADLDPAVVAVRAAPSGPDDPDALDLGRLRSLAILARGGTGREYIALSDGWRRLRLDVVEGSVGDADWVRFEYCLSGFRDLEPRLRTLHRLSNLRRAGCIHAANFPVPARQSHRLEALQVADGLRDGASYREIAEALFGEQRVRAEWRKRSDYLLSRVRRRAGEARRMLAGGYRTLFQVQN